MSLQTLKQSTCLKYFKLVYCSWVPNKKVIFASCSMIFSNCFQWLHTKHWSIIKEFGTGGNSNKSQICSVLNCFIIIPWTWCYKMFFQIIIEHKIILTRVVKPNRSNRLTECLNRFDRNRKPPKTSWTEPIRKLLIFTVK